MKSNLKFDHSDNPNKDFTIISNAIIRDKEVSAAAKMVYIHICSVPKRNFVISVEGLTEMGTWSRSVVMDRLNELEKHGYLKREKNYRNDGKRTYDTYTIFRDPKGILGAEVEEEDCFDDDEPW